MPRKSISVVVLDLDNTLWDWVDIWHRSFSAMVDEISRISEIPKEELYPAISEVHQRHGTSEYAFLIEELEPLRRKYITDPDDKEQREKLLQMFRPAVEAFRKARADAMQLYPTVFETLWTLRDRGCLVLAYTESMGFYTFYRISRLGLDGLIDYLYSPADHDLPAGMSKGKIRRYSSDRYRLRRTKHKSTPAGEFKPNPHILEEILKNSGATADQSIYVGDSKMKDIAMAQDAGVIGVWAKYGYSQNRPEYELLRAVTHWSPEDVQREKDIEVHGEVEPNYTLEHCFAEILNLFDFVSFCPTSSKKAVWAPTDAELGATVEIWKKTIEVQQHFNDIELRIRSIALTLIVAVVGATGFALRERIGVSLFTLSIPLGTIVLFGGLLAWLAFYCMDNYWYHRLLMGAVNHGLLLEKKLRLVLPMEGLTQKIGEESPFPLIFCRKIEVHSKHKMNIFYGIIAFVLILLIVGSVFSV